MMFRQLCAAAALLMATTVALADEIDVTLQVREPAGVARQGDPVSGGVPLPVGAVKDPAQLKLTDADGKEVPAQISPINRWGHDQSLMWVLVQSAASVPANGAATFHLRSGKPAVAPRGLLKVADAADSVTVETGAIKFVVSKKKFNLIDQAWITAGGKNEQVIASGGQGGSELTLKNGEVYTSSAAPPSEVVVEESGPERATIVVRGLHKPANGKGTLPYLYGYLVRIRAYAGQPYLRISYALTNGNEPAIGSPVCKAAAINVPLGLPAAQATAGEGWVAAADERASATLAVRYLKENAPAALSGDAVRTQLGSKANRLALKPWGDQEDFLDICSYKTYEMQLTLAPAAGAAKGDDLLKAYNGYLRFDLTSQWVSETKAWSDFGYVATPDDKVKEAIKNRFKPYSLAGWRDFGSDPEFESGASWAPGGGYEPLIKTAAFYLGYLQTGDRRQFDQGERTAWHWRDRRYIHLDGDWAGKQWEGNKGVYYTYYKKGGDAYPDLQPANYKKYENSWNYGGRYGPMDTQHFSVDEVVNYYYETGDRQCLDALRMYGNEAAGFTAAFVGATGKVKVGRQHGWVARALVSVYEATGEKRYFDLAQAAVKAIMDNQDKTAGTISPILEIEMSAYTHKLGPATHVPFMNAAVGMALGRYYRHHPEPEVRDAILGIADWLAYDVAVNPPKDVLEKNPKARGGFGYTWESTEWKGYSASGNRCMSTMAWAYLATGQKRYLDAADMHAGKLADWYQSGFGQEYVVIKTTQRADPSPPAAVKDLAAEAAGGGKVKLTWAAPSDPDDAQAAEYQVKYATKEIKERSDWRTKGDSEISFWAATNCKNPPTPAKAGAKESFTAEGLTPGTYWFAIKSYDKQPNQSDLSNVVKVEVK